MRLDFNVLWIDDQPDHVQAQIKAISNEMENEGFNFHATQIKTVEEVKQHLADDVFNDEVDLILVDWDLGGSVQGQDVISEIRDSIRFKDVVFYSARTAPTDLRKLAFDAGVEGVYCASREDLRDEVIGVFESLVKKVLDLDHTRGIVMGATSDIDHMVSECLTVIHDGLDDEGKKGMLSEVIDHIGEQLNQHKIQVKNLKDSTSMTALFEAHGIFTAYDRLRILSRQLKTGEQKDKRSTVIEYMTKVVPNRNILGHQVLQPEGKSKTVTNAEGEEISLDETRELRCRILNLRQKFRELLDALSTPS